MTFMPIPPPRTKTPSTTTIGTTSATKGAEEDEKDHSDDESSVGLFDDDKENSEKNNESFDVDAEIDRLSQEIEQFPSQQTEVNTSDSINCMEDSRVMDESKVQ